MNRSFLTIGILCFACIFLPGFTTFPTLSVALEKPAPTLEKKEYFDPSLSNLRSIDDLTNYIDTTFKGDKNSEAFLYHMSVVMMNRFFHTYSYYTRQDNWIARLAGVYIWSDLSAIVIPDDIMKHQHAACSQQTIVLMECAKRFGLDYRKVSFDHHFAAEIKAGGKWHFVDVNLEVISIGQSLEDLVKSNSLIGLYNGKLEKGTESYVLGNPSTGIVNDVEGKKARLFQQVTKALSANFFLLVVIVQSVFFYLYCIRPKNDELI